MLTRLEIDGFKNLLNFSIDFGPFTCIAGPNGVGKSNIFDAIRFLSLLADNTLTDAALKVRDGASENSDLRDIFYATEADRRDQIRIAAEMIVSPDGVRDDFGRLAKPSSTFLRYEVRIGFEPRSKAEQASRLVLLHESLGYVTQGEAATHLSFPHSLEFRNGAVSNKRRGGAYISSARSDDGQIEIHVHQDGRSRGLTQVAPAATAPRTIVGTSNNAATPTILAARREMQSWQVLALEPRSMRRPDRAQDVEPYDDLSPQDVMSYSRVTSHGGQLARTLSRMELASILRRGDRDRTLAEIVARVNQLVPIQGLRIDQDKERRILTLYVREKGGTWLPASSLSDGTLRFLALSILVQDPAEGLICIEEPENGIHPAKMEEVLNLLRDMAIDADMPPDSDNPLRQVIVATHSPTLVQLIHSQNKSDLLFAMSALVRGATGNPELTIRCRPMIGTWRCSESELGVGLSMVLAYLAMPPGTHLSALGLTA